MQNIIFGIHSIQGFLDSSSKNTIIEVLISDNKNKRIIRLIEQFKKQNITINHVSSDKLDTITNKANHQGIVALIKEENVNISTLEDILHKLNDRSSSLVVILDGITDTHNLGAIIRTAFAFNVDAIILPKDNCANINNPIVAKTSSGAIFNIAIAKVTNITQAINELKNNHYWIAAATLNKESIDLNNFNHKGRLAWVIGSEDKGIRRLVLENCDYYVKIPINDKIQSLNVAVATGIILSHSRIILNN